MKRAPSRAEIHAAELAVVESRRLVAEGIQRVRTAVRERLAQPLTLSVAFGAMALLGFWLARRGPRAAMPLAAGAISALAAAGALLRGFAVRHVLGRLFELLQRRR